MMIAKPAPSAPVISHLRPLITHSLPSSRAVVFSMAGIGARAARLGHARSRSGLASASGLQEMLACVGRPRVEQVDVALVGRGAVHRDGPSIE